MKRILLQSNGFIRATKQFLRKNPHLAADVRAALALLAEDAFHPKLKTHKLKGQLEGSWACSGGYDLRVIFEFVRHEDAEAIMLQSLGTHDEVY